MSCPDPHLCLRRSFSCYFSPQKRSLLVFFFVCRFVIFLSKNFHFCRERIGAKSILRRNVLTIYRQVQLLTLANRLILLVDGFTFSLILAAFVQANTSPSLTIWSLDKPGLLKNSEHYFSCCFDMTVIMLRHFALCFLRFCRFS